MGPYQRNAGGRDTRKDAMHLRTVLNAVYRHKGFVYGNESLNHQAQQITICVRPRKGSRPCCSGCGRSGPTYDHLPARGFNMTPFWGLAVVFLYAMRRVDCRNCNRITVEQVPWSIGGKSRLTTAFVYGGVKCGHHNPGIRL